MRTDQIALQLYTVREEAARDFLGTLRRVAELGYRAVEFAGYGGIPATELRARLDEYGLRAPGAHVPFADFAERMEPTLADLRTLGCEFAVVPSLPRESRESPAQIRRAAALFERWGDACRATGLRFGYHNHAFEFSPLDEGGRSVTPFEILAATDPALVALELDVYWAQHAGVDPVDLIQRHGGRVPLLHVKDMADDADRADVPVGEGTLPWPRILAAAAAAGTRWYVVEQDHPRDALDDVRRSLRNLEQL